MQPAITPCEIVFTLAQIPFQSKDVLYMSTINWKTQIDDKLELHTQYEYRKGVLVID